MAMSLSDNPKADKPAENKPATAEPKAEEKKEAKKLDTGDSRLNNQTNDYGVTSDHSEAEENQKKIEKIDKASADVLAAAAGSSDAGIQNLLGQRAVAVTNVDEDELKRIDKELAELVK